MRNPTLIFHFNLSKINLRKDLKNTVNLETLAKLTSSSRPSLPDSDTLDSDIEMSKLTASLLALIVTFSAIQSHKQAGTELCQAQLQLGLD